MDRRFWCLILALLCAAAPCQARRDPPGCGTSRETANDRLFFHRQALRRPHARAVAAPSNNRDAVNIAIIEDTDGVVARQNDFNLDRSTLQFTPGSAGYRYAVSDGGYDDGAASAGAPLAALDDDDSRAVSLPFAFPFFGATYRQVYVNSDGNLTFTTPDMASTDRSLGRMTAGPPRIAPLFDDLDPAETAGGVRVLAESGRVVVSWVAVPEWVSYGAGAQQTFQAKLYPDGRIEFSYAGVRPSNAVVGIAPGALKGATALVDYTNDPSTAYTAAIAERFGNALDIDIVTVAQKFYQTHEDAYDYLVIYNDMDISAMSDGVVAYETTVRSGGAGYGSERRDDGAMYGSASRLQSVLNMGPLSQYPDDPDAVVPARRQAGDTPLTILGHETGHLFLAYASTPDANDPTARPMLGYQNAHWAFTFNSEASLLEGERILDRGPGVSPRFLTTATVQGYSPLDQYLMGFRPAGEVPDTFLVTGTPAYMQQWHPATGFQFDGERQNISVSDVVQAMGRRTPDSAIAQRRFRFAFILVVAHGTDPSAADLAKIESFRQQYEAAYAKFASNNASAQTTLRRSLKLSLFPAAGIVQGSGGTGSVTVATPPDADMPIRFTTVYGAARFPESVMLRAGAHSASFPYAGGPPGVEEVTAIPGDPAYETAFARVQVAGALQLKLVATGSDPVIVKLTDANGLVYPGVRIVAAALPAGSAVTPASAVTDAQGQVALHWTRTAAPTNVLQVSLESLPAVLLTLRAGSAVPSISSVVNAASFAPGLAAGALATVFGANFANARVLLNGTPVPATYTDDTQINFYVPAETRLGAATLTVQGASGQQASADISVAAVQPGLFAVAGTPRPGGFLTIYGTGFGPTKAGADGLQHTVATPVVFIGAVPVQPVFSGLSPGTPGLYQINLKLPADIPPGPQDILVSVNLAHSNAIRVEVQ